MTTLLVPVAVSISFAVPSISKTSVAKLILSFDPESADTARFELDVLVSTYALIDCWVANAAALLDAKLSSSSIVVIPTNDWPNVPISSWVVVVIPVILTPVFVVSNFLLFAKYKSILLL